MALANFIRNGHLCERVQLGNEFEELKLQLEKYRLSHREEEHHRQDEGLKKLLNASAKGALSLVSTIKQFTKEKDQKQNLDDGASEKVDKFRRDMAEQRQKDLEKKAGEADLQEKLKKENQAIELALLREKTQMKKTGGRGGGRGRRGQK
jgi:hypothetical protein